MWMARAQNWLPSQSYTHAAQHQQVDAAVQNARVQLLLIADCGVATCLELNRCTVCEKKQQQQNRSDGGENTGKPPKSMQERAESQ